ncbi:AmmeMemoRadiSam system radical SAM enzyme [Anaerotardibacter muris]|uniref:AmmeMemoRadiSam system radical SAM enzyme n=1 Tax=Anaerotardibacter muris TaxID=2941505 RepID=UPI00203C3341|nr:AmmeMemoRadiSam system radical SAM enzyme [Anaerotardibacter muris]
MVGSEPNAEVGGKVESAMASPDKRAFCTLCPHRCSLAEGQRGICQARIARDGVVIDENYGRITSLALDPIEKKPLARFMPGSSILSIGSYGCNMHCGYCQNASIAQVGPAHVEWRQMEPADIAEMASMFALQGNIGVAFTYNEPLVGFEFVRNCAREVHQRGMKNVLVSNGQINPEPLAELLPLIDAANIDLKGFTPAIYRRLGGDLETTLATIEAMANEPNLHLEVTTLVVPGLNDSPDQMAKEAAWIASLDPQIPLHVTRFFPCYKMLQLEPTPLDTLHALADVARESLDFVYLGNC